jgi:hypothetical protein
MKKLYVDDILAKGDRSQPGPGKYESKDLFGKAQGINFSMGARLPNERHALEKSMKLPGPGSYKQDDFLGKELNNSMYKTTNNFSIAKDKRFNVATRKEETIAPGSYEPKNNLN